MDEKVKDEKEVRQEKKPADTDLVLIRKNTLTKSCFYKDLPRKVAEGWRKV
jgi:hypothetical protein